ncbi:MFS transporter [Pseudonocardia xinjiangensis]|uniref:MFS transporter n=1 Tax=Pseudonocardia xinjiangensis TaxID=75289 RepID=UPI003D8EEABF
MIAGMNDARRAWLGLAVLVLPALLASMDLSVLFMAAPWLSADLAPSGTQLLWIMDVYGFLIAGFLITMGSLGDRIGRRRLLLLGAGAFGGASVLAAYASTPEMLIAARALLGVGGAVLAPSTLALIRSMFPEDRDRRVAIGIWTGAFTGGVAIGPIVGGLLLEQFWWGSVFLINVPVMLLLLVVGPVLVPESRDPRPGRFDVLSALLSLAAVLPVVYGVKEAAAHALGMAPALAVLGGCGFAVLFVRRQLQLADPMIDIRLLRSRGFGAALGAQTVIVLASAGMGYLAVQFLQLVLGLRPFVAALWMLPTVAGTAIGIGLATVLVRTVRPAVVVGAGTAVAAAGFALVGMVGTGSSVLAVMSAYTVLTFGTGMVAPLAIDLIVTTAPPERAGAAAAVGETGAEFGGAVGIAVLGTVATAVYRDEITGALPAALPPDVAEAATGTLGGAMAAARQLPDPTPVLTIAGEAFVSGFTTAATLAATLLTVAAVVVTARLWSVRPADAPAPV